ncbi:MAG: acetylxylan esterase [Acidobacteria bacterium]|nr:acetylxylan esterase [Acidobacteriota bacterium]
MPLSRRSVLTLPAAFATRSWAAPIDYRDYSRCLPDYLARLAREAAAKRAAALDACTTPALIRARQKHVRESFWSLIGGQPERTPLNIRTTGTFTRPDYTVEHLVYESRPGLLIAANLYLPKSGEQHLPGVLFQMGHSLNGKAAALYQYCIQGLVQLGFAVLAFDPMGQGERTAYPDPETGLTRLRSADNEHTYPGKQLILGGDTATRLQTWDSVRSLDVLASHPRVDPKRLASTGNSGGGTTTMFLSAVDDRLACAAPACPNTENHALARLNGPGSVDDAEQCILDGPSKGIDRWDLLHPLAPKPLLILVSARDWFGTYSPDYLTNGRAEFARLQAFYKTLGAAAENLQWYESPLPHGLGYNVRLEIYNFLLRHLQGRGTRLDKEPPTSAEPDATLFAAQGNVARLNSKTPFVLARDLSTSIQTPPASPALPKALAAALRLDPPSPKPARVLGRVSSRGCDAEAIEIDVTAEVTVPAWVFRPRVSTTKPPLILLEPSGRSVNWGEDSLYQQLAASGRLVIAPDLRGLGDLRPELSRHGFGNALRHQDEDAYAWASMMLGRPLLGQRVSDILAVVRAATALYGSDSVHVAALSHLTVPALCAAALEPRIASLHLSRHLASWRSLATSEQYNHPFANFLYGILRLTDLPQIAASVAPRPITITALSDPTAAPLYTSSNVKFANTPPWALATFGA